MAIVNITPDSFFSGSRNTTDHEIASTIERALSHGADILDLGAYSTRPGADDIPLSEELSRLDRAIRILKEISAETPFSVDTFRSQVVQTVYNNWGEFIVNDISAGELDNEMIPLVGQLRLPYIAMHSRGTPQTMQTQTSYEDLTGEIVSFFEAKIHECQQAGITDLTIDPGFGFAKTTIQNFELLKQLHRLEHFGLPVLVGVSRKSMVWRTLNITPAESLNGTSALNWEALRQGASILRVHDVKEAVEITKLFNTFASC